MHNLLRDEVGLKSKRPFETFRLNQTHKNKRLEWAKNMQAAIGVGDGGFGWRTRSPAKWLTRKTYK